MTTPQQAYDALNILISYSVERWMEWFKPWMLARSPELINRLKPYTDILQKELLDIENNLSDKYTTLKFAPDWNNHWKCEKCWNMQAFACECHECWRKSITWANWENNYSLIR